MGSVNKWIGIGNLGKNCELRYTPAGTPVGTFSIACTETWTDKASQKQERTEWLRCVLWGKMAESLNEYLTRGKQIYVEGRVQTRKYQDKDGNDKYSTEIRADRIVLLGGKSGGGARRERTNEQVTSEAEEPQQAQPAASDQNWDDDIPFAWLLPFVLPLTGLLGIALV